MSALVAPTLDAVKSAHAQRASRRSSCTRARSSICRRPSGATRSSSSATPARLASKLQLGLGLAGGLGYRTLPEVIQAAPAAERVAVGRAALTRALLVGLDRALRDLRALVA